MAPDANGIGSSGSSSGGNNRVHFRDDYYHHHHHHHHPSPPCSAKQQRFAYGSGVEDAHNDPALFHPLDWASHLRRSLVTAPVPCILTLLLVTAHYGACSLVVQQQSPGGAAGGEAWKGLFAGSQAASEASPFSVLGTIFSAVSRAAALNLRLFDASDGGSKSRDGGAGPGGIHMMVRTPFHDMAMGQQQQQQHQAHHGDGFFVRDEGCLNHEEVPFSMDEGHGDTAYPSSPSSSSSSSPYSGGENAPSNLLLASEGVMGLSLFSDPFTFVYDAWNAHVSSSAGAGDPSSTGGGHNADDGQESRKRAPTHPNTGNQNQRCGSREGRRRRQEERGGGKNGGTGQASAGGSGGGIGGGGPASSTPASTAWAHVCIMHAIGAAGVLIALAPSLVCGRQHLACNIAIPRVHSSAWPLVNSSVAVFGLSFLASSTLLHVAGLQDLAMCMSMHMVARIIAAYVDVVQSCPLPPVFMQGAAASGMGIAMGILVLYVGHVEEGAKDFYMNHAWACWVAVLLARHTVMRAAAGVLCSMQARVVQRVAMGGGGSGDEGEDEDE